MSFFLPLILWWIFIAIVLIAIYKVFTKREEIAYKGKRTSIGKVFGGEELSEQMEFDLRLTYKRFKELYPFTNITYEQYKKMQMERAFKRAVGSERNKRMVR